jgi:glucose-6-phosphate isomerase
MKADIPRLERLSQNLRSEGFTHALLLGMGGSSLAPEVFRETFGVREGYLDLAILDSTDPGAVAAHRERLDLAKTLFIVATKSGGTVETLSFFKYFFNQVAEAFGADRAGEHFVAITDPGSKLVDIAQRFGFREIFLNDPNIGGRYSALSYFGLVPASLVGVDTTKLLDRAMVAVCNCDGCNSPAYGDNLGAQLGAIMGTLTEAGRDKLAFILSPEISAFGDWVEQLIAESTGKDGKGILPVVGETVGAPESYADDRLFVHLRFDDDDTDEETVQALQAAGHPLVRLNLKDLYDLGGQFFLWEMATAVAGHLLGINPFDQPNVESAKTLARQMVAAYQERGELPERPPSLTADGIKVYSDLQVDTLEEVLKAFLDQAQPGSYLALQAYLNPTADTDAAIQTLRTRLRDHTRMAVTSGYGPRFLHSTGQLHKGDAGLGLFIQLTADSPLDIDIPDEAGSGASSISFGVLESAQALGDRQALQKRNRCVIQFHLGGDIPGGLNRLCETVDAEARR